MGPGAGPCSDEVARRPRQDPELPRLADGGGPGVNMEPFEGMLEMRSNRVRRDRQVMGDLVVRSSDCRQRQDLGLAVRQTELPSSATDERSAHLGADEATELPTDELQDRHVA